MPDADPQTLEVLMRGMLFFWRDKNSVWYHHTKLQGADVSEGDVEVYPQSVYCRIGNRIWGMGSELEEVDVDSFLVTDWNYAEDKHGRFYCERRLNEADDEYESR